VIYNPEITANLRSAATRENLQSEEHLAAVLVLAETLDMRDASTARHSETVGRYAKQIAIELGMSAREVAAERVYKAPMPEEAAREELLRCAGSQFDPSVVLAFVNALGRVRDEERAQVA
jgi:HD-GYP domain-containing protein (c-di-GMP phosphodiesterase class II)